MAKRSNENLFKMWPRKGKTVRIEKSSFPDAPPAWFGLTFLAFGIGSLALAASVLFAPSHDLSGKIFGSLFFLAFGGAFTFAGVLLLYLRRDIPRTLPMKDLSHHLGLATTEIERLVRERQVVPRYTIKGRDLYHPDDFDVTSLLRGSAVPAATEELLRAADSVKSRPEDLVRGSSAQSSSALPIEGGSTIVSSAQDPQEVNKLRRGGDDG